MLTSRDSALYVEKPFARTLAEHNDLCTRFPDSRVAIGFQRRALGVVTMMKAMVSNEIFGRLKRVEFSHGGSANVFSGKAFASDPNLAGGGVVYERGIHGIDLLVHITQATSAGSVLSK